MAASAAGVPADAGRKRVRLTQVAVVRLTAVVQGGDAALLAPVPGIEQPSLGGFVTSIDQLAALQARVVDVNRDLNRQVRTFQSMSVQTLWRSVCAGQSSLETSPVHTTHKDRAPLFVNTVPALLHRATDEAAMLQVSSGRRLAQPLPSGDRGWYFLSDGPALRKGRQRGPGTRGEATPRGEWPWGRRRWWRWRQRGRTGDEAGGWWATTAASPAAGSR